MALLAERELGPVNVDCTVIIEAPALAPHRERIRARLAEALGLDARAGQREGHDLGADGVRRAPARAWLRWPWRTVEQVASGRVQDR